MPKFHIRQVKRIKNLVTVSALTAIILVVSTFAWFVGMRTVNVSSFDIEIASTDSLLLSLDGEKFEHTVTISQATLNDVSYDGHTNSWGGGDLFQCRLLARWILNLQDWCYMKRQVLLLRLVDIELCQ